MSPMEELERDFSKLLDALLVLIKWLFIVGLMLQVVLLWVIMLAAGVAVVLKLVG